LCFSLLFAQFRRFCLQPYFCFKCFILSAFTVCFWNLIEFYLSFGFSLLSYPKFRLILFWSSYRLFGFLFLSFSFGLVSLFLAIIYHKNIHFASRNVVQSKQVPFV